MRRIAEHERFHLGNINPDQRYVDIHRIVVGS